MFERRRFLPDTIASGSPVVLAERRVPNVTRSLTFYFHYDGQPVEAREWTYGPPFSPIIVTGPDASARRLTLDQVKGAIDPSWRVYGRSSSDDKSPIVAFVNFDNNQRERKPADQESVGGIDSMAALLTMPWDRTTPLACLPRDLSRGRLALHEAFVNMPEREAFSRASYLPLVPFQFLPQHFEVAAR